MPETNAIVEVALTRRELEVIATALVEHQSNLLEIIRFYGPGTRQHDDATMRITSALTLTRRIVHASDEAER